MPTTIFHPDPGNGRITVDGRAASSFDDTWANIRAAAGNAAADSGATENLILLADGAGTLWSFLQRMIFLFDTSGLDNAAVIRGAQFLVASSGVVDTLSPGAGAVSLCASLPASDNAVTGTDYSTLGTTKFATDRLLADIVTDSLSFNVWNLNAAGLAAIDVSGITKLGLRITNDLEDDEPTLSANGERSINMFMADEVAADDIRPRLVVTWSIAQAGREESDVIGEMGGPNPIQIVTRMVGT